MRWQRIIWPAFATCLGLLLLLHACLGRYAHPMADDFSYALKDMSSGIWSATAWEYTHWNGRFASNFLVLLGPMRWGFDSLWLYRLVPALLIALSLSGALTLIRAVSPTLSRGHALIGALIWVGLYAHLMPDMGEGLYWYTGSVTYQLPSAVLLFAISALVHNQRTRARWSWAAGAVLLVCCIGCNEVMMTLIVAGAMGAAIRAWRYKRMRTSGWCLLVIVAAASLAVIIAPGNAMRGAHFDGTHRLLPSVGMSLLQTARFSASWIFCGSLFAFSMLWWMNRAWFEHHSPQLVRGFGLSPWLTTTVLGAVVFLCAFPPYWSTGILGQHRTMNVACFFFLPIWFVNLSAWLTHMRRWRTPASLSSLLALALLVLVVVDITVSGNTNNAIGDLLTGHAERSDRQLHDRYALFRSANARPDGTASVPLISDPPKSLYVLDLRDPLFLVNRDYAAWFNLKEVRIAAHVQSERAKATN